MYAQTAWKLIKLYAPSVILGVVSLGTIIASDNIQRSRNAALASAYAAVDSSFKAYRKRVAEKFGEDTEYDLRHNIKAATLKKTSTDKTTACHGSLAGEEVTTATEVRAVPLDICSEYARFFDESCSAWARGDPDYNAYFVSSQEHYANDKLIVNGYLFLNDVYDALGIPRTKAGQVVGWRRNSKNANSDNYVDFGAREVEYIQEDGKVGTKILLDFNVDGYILDDFTPTDKVLV